MFKVDELKIDPEIFENPLFSIHMKSIRYLGLIIGKNQKYQALHLMRAYFVIFAVIFVFILNFIKVTRSLHILEHCALSCATTFLFLSMSIFVLNAVYHRKRISLLVNFVHYDLKSLLSSVDATEQSYFQSNVRALRLMTWSVFAPSISACIAVCLDCVYRTIFYPEQVFNVEEVLNGNAQPVLLFRIFPFVEIIDNFIIGYLFPFYGFLLAITFVPLGNTFMVCLMRYILIKSQIICDRMKDMDVSKLIDHNNNRNNDDHPDGMEMALEDRCLQMCKFCVDEQIKIRWYINELEALLRVPVFLYFIIWTLLICFIFYAFNSGIYQSLSKLDFIFMYLYLHVVLLILWMYHWHATIIALCNDDLRFAIYSSNWYNYTLKVQKSLRLIMTETHVPLQMRAIFIDMNLNTFINTVRGAYGYFSILRNINN